MPAVPGLVSGFALIYYLRFWFVYHFPEPTLPGGLTGRRFFDEVVIWVEHLPVLLLVALAWLLGRRGNPPRASGSKRSGPRRIQVPVSNNTGGAPVTTE